MYRFVLCMILCGLGVKSVKAAATSSAIPELLYNCYSSNFTEFEAPFTIRLLVELLRKVELDPKNALNMRIFATSLLHGVIFDGVRKAEISTNDDGILIPYRATGSKFYKYKLLVDYLTSGESSLFPADSLSANELCFLHMLLSNTVDPLLRGDESTTCAHQSKMPLEFEALEEEYQISSCPIKKGSVYTKWGSVSAGHLIAGIASALEPMSEKFERIEAAINNKTLKNPPSIANAQVNNVWVATIAGDLASAVLNQANYDLELGAPGFWNDTLIPSIYYLKSTTWDVSEADVLGGIDGLSIAHYLENTELTHISLSKVIDMYYSEGRADLSVANRSFTMSKLLNEINLEEQVSSTAKLLQRIGTYDILLDDDKIDKLSAIAVALFKKLSENITQTYDATEVINEVKMKSPMEIIVIVDGTYEFYTWQQLISAIADATEVSIYRSQIGIINGQTGNWIVNVTGELFQLFTDLNKAKFNWPGPVTLSTSLETIMYYYENSTMADCGKSTKPLGRTIFFLTSARLTDNDITQSLKAFNSIKRRNPETSFFLVTSAASKSGFSPLITKFRDNDRVLTPSGNTNSMIQTITSALSSLPGSFINFYCKQAPKFLGVITPTLETIYQVRKEYLPGTAAFYSRNGRVQICGNLECQELDAQQEVTFDSRALCGGPDCSLNFSVVVNSSEVPCDAVECRYLDQVMLELSWRISSGSRLVNSVFLVIAVVCLLKASY